MRTCRGLLVLCLLACAASAGANEPGASRDRILASGLYTVRVREGGLDTGGGFVRVSRNGRPLVTLRDWRIQGASIQPLLGPHSADLVVQTFSGGAHYRTVIYIIHLGSRLRPLLTFSADNYETTEFKDLDHDGRPELLAWDDSFAYYGFSFAASPALPFVFRSEGGRYRDATARYRWLVKADQEKGKRRLVEAVHRRVDPEEPNADPSHQALWREEAIRSATIQVYGDGLLLGNSTQARHWLRTHLPREHWPWFQAHRRAIRRTLQTRDRKLSYRLRTPPPYTAFWQLEGPLGE